VLENHWSAGSIFVVAAIPLVVAAVATICVRFSVYVDPAASAVPTALGSH
jgi:hypothetical protein